MIKGLEPYAMINKSMNKISMANRRKFMIDVFLFQVHVTVPGEPERLASLRCDTEERRFVACSACNEFSYLRSHSDDGLGSRRGEASQK